VARFQISCAEDNAHTTATDFLEQFAVSKTREWECAGHIASQGSGFALRAGVFEHCEHGEDFADSGGVQREASRITFRGRTVALSQFVDELRREHFEGDASPLRVVFVHCRQSEQLEVGIGFVTGCARHVESRGLAVKAGL
jgi:hypothetical protein